MSETENERLIPIKSVHNSCDGGFFTKKHPWPSGCIITGISLGGIGGSIIGGPFGGFIGALLGLVAGLSVGFLSSMALLTLECCCHLPDKILTGLHYVLPSISVGVTIGSIVGMALSGPASPAGALAGSILGFIAGGVIGLLCYGLIPLVSEAFGKLQEMFCENAEMPDVTRPGIQ